MDVKKISLLSLFIALSVVGAMIKIPAIVGSVALDAFPALLASGLLGGGAGAIVGAAGHLLSALNGGMPLGPLHFIVAAEMAVLAYLFAVFYKRGNKIFSGVLFVVGNTLVAPLPFIFLISLEFYIALLPSLFVGSLLNTVLALFAVPRLHPFLQGAIRKGDLKG